jgi:hypothetical protein
MAKLTAPQLAELSAQYQREISDVREPIAITKPDLAAAWTAADAWVEANAASFNAALPLPARTVLTAKQKSRLLTYVIRKRYEEEI